MELQINPVNLTVFIIGVVMISVLTFSTIYFAIKLARSLVKNKQNEVDLKVYEMQLAEMVSQRDVKTVEETQGFLKFISESRDWAFEYIEDVQQALRAYDIALSMDDAKVLNDAYKKLVSFLPDDDVVN